jgi:hypothetical protein
VTSVCHEGVRSGGCTLASIRPVTRGQRESASRDATYDAAILHVSSNDRAGAHKRRFADCHAGRHHHMAGDDRPSSNGNRFEAIAVVVAGPDLDVLGCVEHRVRPDQHSPPTAKASETIEGGIEVYADLLSEPNAPGGPNLNALTDRYAGPKFGEERAVTDAAKAYAQSPGEVTQESVNDAPLLLTAARRTG